MAIEVFNRYEKKYMIDESTYKKMMKVLRNHMVADKYCVNDNFYSICNIYFDTDNDELIRTSIEKPIYKEKLRMRSYGVPKNDDEIFLEIKKKYNRVVNKRRTTLSLAQAKRFMDTGYLPKEGDKINSQVVKELNYFMKVYHPIPKVFLAYDRMALFGIDDKDLRITFDKNIRSRRERVDLTLGDDGEKLIPDGYYLMEIKVANAFPLWLTHLLTKYKVENISFSKYGTEYKKYITKRSEEAC